MSKHHKHHEHSKPKRRRRHEKISILVPFQSDEPFRVAVWEYLESYYREMLPEAEIIIGKDPKSRKSWRRRKPLVYSKTKAINNAYKKSTGDIIVIMDADAFLEAEWIEHCADRIRYAQEVRVKLWFMPYTNLYRLRKWITELILIGEADPCEISDPPDPCEVENVEGENYGHQWGALCMIMPYQAFERVRGGDERFRGWGGEDGSLLRALDTLWSKHKLTPNQILHFWHPRLIKGAGKNWEIRIWEGQDNAKANDELARRYIRAIGDPEAMDAVINSAPEAWWKRLWDHLVEVFCPD